MLELTESHPELGDRDKYYHEKTAKGSDDLLALLKKFHGTDIEKSDPRPLPTGIEPKCVIFISDVVKAVGQHFGFGRTELLSVSHAAELVRARFILYFLCQAVAGKSMTAIGRALDRDHSTIRHGIHKIRDMRKVDTGLEMDLRVLAASLGGSLD